MPETEGGEFLWDCYTRLSRFRAMGTNGPDPLTPRDIRDWCEMMGTILRREEAEILIDMDASYRETWRIETEENAARERDQKTMAQRQPRRR